MPRHVTSLISLGNDAIHPPRCGSVMDPRRVAPSMWIQSLHRSLINYSFILQSETKKRARTRAVLQAIAIPRRSYKKNLEEAQQQFESKSLSWDQDSSWSYSKFSIYFNSALDTLYLVQTSQFDHCLALSFTPID